MSDILLLIQYLNFDIDNHLHYHHMDFTGLARRNLDANWMIVCVCNRLNDQRIGAAICGGAENADDVYARCGVRKNCGRCQETIENLLEENRRALSLAAE